MGTQSFPEGFFQQHPEISREQAEWGIAWSKYRAGVYPWYEDPGVVKKFNILEASGPGKYYEFLQSRDIPKTETTEGKTYSSADYASDIAKFEAQGYSREEAVKKAGESSYQPTTTAKIQYYIEQGYSQSEASRLASLDVRGKLTTQQTQTITTIPQQQVLTPQQRATQQFQEQQSKAKTWQPLPFTPKVSPLQQQPGIILTPAGKVAVEGIKTARDIWSGGLMYGYLTTPTTKTKEQKAAELNILTTSPTSGGLGLPGPIATALQTVYMRRAAEERIADIKRQEVSREKISKELATAEASIQKWKDYKFKSQEEYDKYLSEYEDYQSKIKSAEQRLAIVGYDIDKTETGFTIKGLEPPKSIYTQTLERGTTAEKIGMGVAIFGGKAVETYTLSGLAGPVFGGISGLTGTGIAAKIGGQVVIGGATGLFLGLEGGQAVKGYVEYGPWGLTKPIAEVGGVAGGIGLRYLTAPVTRTKVTYEEPKGVGTSEPKIIEFQGKTIGERSLQQYTVKSAKTTTTSETTRFREMFGQSPLSETSKTVVYRVYTPGKFVGGKDYLTFSEKGTSYGRIVKATQVSGGQQQIDIKDIPKLTKVEQYVSKELFAKVPGGYKEGDIIIRGEPFLQRLTGQLDTGKTTQQFVSLSLARPVKTTDAGTVYNLFSGFKDVSLPGARAAGNIPILESRIFVKTPTTTQLNIPTGVTTKGYELPRDLKNLVLGNLMSGQTQTTQLTIPVISQQLAGKTLLTTATKQISPGELVGGTIGTIAGLQTKESTKTKYFSTSGIIEKPIFEQKTETTTKEGTGGIAVPYYGQVGIVMPSETTREADKLITFQPIEERQETTQRQQTTPIRQRFFFPFTPYTPEATVGYYGWPPISPVPVIFPGMPKLGGYASQKYGGKTKKRKFKYTPTLIGISSGKTIKKPIKGTLTGGEVRYPLEVKKKKGKSLKNIFGF